MRHCTACTFPNNPDQAANCGYCNSLNLGPPGQPGNPAWVPPAAPPPGPAPQQQPQGAPPAAAHGAANLGAPQQAQQAAAPQTHQVDANVRGVPNSGIATGIGLAVAGVALALALAFGGSSSRSPLPPPTSDSGTPAVNDASTTSADAASGTPLIQGPLVANVGNTTNNGVGDSGDRNISSIARRSVVFRGPNAQRLANDWARTHPYPR